MNFQDAALFACFVDLLWRVYKASAAAAKRVMAEQDKPAPNRDPRTRASGDPRAWAETGDGNVVYLFDNDDRGKTH